MTANDFETAKKELFTLFIKYFDILENNSEDLFLDFTILSIIHNKPQLSKLFFQSLKFNEGELCRKNLQIYFNEM